MKSYINPTLAAFPGALSKSQLEAFKKVWYLQYKGPGYVNKEAIRLKNGWRDGAFISNSNEPIYPEGSFFQNLIWIIFNLLLWSWNIIEIMRATSCLNY